MRIKGQRNLAVDFLSCLNFGSLNFSIFYLFSQQNPPYNDYKELPKFHK